MVYFKILSADGTVKSVEALADPVYVCWQTRNGILIRCDKRDAQGVMSGDGNTIYQLQGKQLSGVESDELLSAVSITLAEYEELAAFTDDVPFTQSAPRTPTTIRRSIRPTTPERKSSPARSSPKRYWPLKTSWQRQKSCWG